MRALILSAGRRVAALLLALSLATGADAGASNPPPPNPTPGYLNLNPALIPHWRACVAKVRALGSTSRCTLLVIDDSTGAGAGAGTGGTTNYNGARLVNMPTVLSKMLNPYVHTNDNSVFGTQNVAVAYPSYDARMVYSGAGWGSVTGQLVTLGGVNFHYLNGAAGTAAYTPVDPNTGAAFVFDTFIVYYMSQPAPGSLTVNVDGGATCSPGGAINTNATAAFHSATCTVAKAAHTINLVAANDGPLNISGIKVYDSTVPAIDILQVSQAGGTVLDYARANQPYSQANLITALAPDGCLIGLTVNDAAHVAAGGATIGFSDISTYPTVLQSIVANCKQTGDAILMTGPPSSDPYATNGTLDSYIAAMRGVAAATGSPMVDIKQRFTSWAVSNPIMPYFDSIHQTKPGYQDMAAAAYRVLTLP